MIYYHVYSSSEGENEYPYIPKKIGNSDIRYIISLAKELIGKISNYIIDHAKSIPIKVKYVQP